MEVISDKIMRRIQDTTMGVIEFGGRFLENPKQ